MDKEIKDYLDVKFDNVSLEIKNVNDVNQEQHGYIIERLDKTNGNVQSLCNWRGGAEVEIARNSVHRNNVLRGLKWFVGEIGTIISGFLIYIITHG